MRPIEVVVREVQRGGSDVVLQFLRECVRQARVPANVGEMKLAEVFERHSCRVPPRTDCPWTKAYREAYRGRGGSHQAALFEPDGCSFWSETFCRISFRSRRKSSLIALIALSLRRRLGMSRSPKRSGRRRVDIKQRAWRLRRAVGDCRAVLPSPPSTNRLMQVRHNCLAR